MKKIKCLVASLLFAGSINAQLIDEQNVTITMDLQPVLQLNMDGPSNIDFVFDEIYEYMGGITKYGATALKVSSSVSWDLYAVGYSSGNNISALSWDAQVSYGNTASGLGSTVLSCALLELKQDKLNPAKAGAAGATGGDDYFLPFATVVTAAALNNNIYISATPYVAPAVTEKYIAGHNLATAVNAVVGGSYLTVGATGNYYYIIDYRIVPGLPAIFPNTRFPNALPVNIAATPTANHLVLAGNYARPGVYTMNVKYVLREN